MEEFEFNKNPKKWKNADDEWKKFIARMWILIDESLRLINTKELSVVDESFCTLVSQSLMNYIRTLNFFDKEEEFYLENLDEKYHTIYLSFEMAIILAKQFIPIRRITWKEDEYVVFDIVTKSFFKCDSTTKEKYNFSSDDIITNDWSFYKGKK